MSERNKGHPFLWEGSYSRLHGLVSRGSAWFQAPRVLWVDTCVKYTNCTTVHASSYIFLQDVSPWLHLIGPGMASYISQANQSSSVEFFPTRPKRVRPSLLVKVKRWISWAVGDWDSCHLKKAIGSEKEWSQCTRKQRRGTANTHLVPAVPETSSIPVLVVGGLVVQPSLGFHESKTSFFASASLTWVCNMATWESWKNAAGLQRAAVYHGSHCIQTCLQPAQVTRGQLLQPMHREVCARYVIRRQQLRISSSWSLSKPRDLSFHICKMGILIIPIS